MFGNGTLSNSYSMGEVAKIGSQTTNSTTNYHFAGVVGYEGSSVGSAVYGSPELSRTIYCL